MSPVKHNPRTLGDCGLDAHGSAVFNFDPDHVRALYRGSNRPA